MTTAHMPAPNLAYTGSIGEAALTSLAREFNGSTEDAFSAMVEKYSTFAYNIAYRILNNVHDAEDAVQDAFISAHRALPTFKGQSKVSTWLYRIVVNASLLKIRRERNRTKYLAEAVYDDAIVPDWRNDPEKAAIDGELGDVLQSGLTRLSPELRAAIVLRDVQGLTNEEAAEALGITVPALKSRLHRGRVCLRKYLEPYLAKPGSQNI